MRNDLKHICQGIYKLFHTLPYLLQILTIEHQNVDENEEHVKYNSPFLRRRLLKHMQSIYKSLYPKWTNYTQLILSLEYSQLDGEYVTTTDISNVA